MPLTSKYVLETWEHGLTNMPNNNNHVKHLVFSMRFVIFFKFSYNCQGRSLVLLSVVLFKLCSKMFYSAGRMLTSKLAYSVRNSAGKIYPSLPQNPLQSCISLEFKTRFFSMAFEVLFLSSSETREQMCGWDEDFTCEIGMGKRLQDKYTDFTCGFFIAFRLPATWWVSGNVFL